MTTSIWLRDIGSFSAQLALVITMAALLARLCRITDSRVMLAYWRSVLLACLILPFCQEWKTAVSIPIEQVTATVANEAASRSYESVTTARPAVRVQTDELVLLVLLAGVAIRGLWLALGVFSLRRLRRTAVPLLPVPHAVEEAQARVGARAAVYVSDRVSGPVSFGLIRPVIVVPHSVLGLDARLQQAITCHELLHVRRRDWLDEILEEIVRTVFWFHPAVRWLLARVRLSREQVVDQAVVQLTESRESYVEALLAVALAKSSPTLVPAPLFFRRGLLKERVAHVLQESPMTIRRIIASLALSVAALVFVAATAVKSFPLEARAGDQDARVQDSGAPVQIVRGGENLLHGALPEYPRRAVEQRIEGDVILDLTIDERGEVSDARVLTGPEELRRAALESVLQWHYSPAVLRSTSIQAALRFRVPAESAQKPGEAELREKLHRAAAFIKHADPKENDIELKEFTVKFEGSAEDLRRAEHRLAELGKALENPAVSVGERAVLESKYVDTELALAKARKDHEMGLEGRSKWLFLADPKPEYTGSPTLARVEGERVPQAMIAALLTRAGVKIGDVVNSDMEKRIEEIARTIDEHLELSFIGNDDKRTLTIVLRLP